MEYKEHPVYIGYLVSPTGEIKGPSGRILKHRLSSKNSKSISVGIKYNNRKLVPMVKQLVFDTWERPLKINEKLELIQGEECNLANIHLIGSEHRWFSHPKHVEYRATSSGLILGKSGNYVNPCLCSDTGYMRITMKSNSNNSLPYLAHRFIYECISQELIVDNLTIDHIDGNKTNNDFSNLDLVTQGENNRRAKVLGLNKGYGETHYNAKLTYREVLEIKSRFSSNEPASSIHKDFSKVQIWTLYAIKQKRNWK